MRRLLSVLFAPIRVCAVAIASASKAHAWPTLCPVNRYLATYYNNLTHTGIPALVRCEKSAGAAWAANHPGLVRAGHFSVVYSGSIDFPSDGTYNWNANVSDVTIKVTLDGASVIDEPNIDYTDYLVSNTVTKGVHKVAVTVVDAAKDGAADFSVSPAGTGAPSTNGNFFAADSFFNRSIPAHAAIDPQSLLWVALLYADPKVSGIVFNYDAWSVPIYRAPAGTPTVTITLRNTNPSRIRPASDPVPTRIPILR
jgi:hypothetical protein